MKDIIKVKVVRKGSSNWYRVGETYEVENPPVEKWNSDIGSSVLSYVVSDNRCIWLRAEHCEIVEPPLQERLQAAKDAVAAIEKQLVEEAEKEASRPFTQAEYEAVVKAYRACKGRVKLACESAEWKWCFTISQTSVYADSWSFSTLLPFGVAFEDEESANAAIAEVGAENLKKAWEYEMSIGL